MGRRVHYYFNYSSTPVSAKYTYAAGSNLLTSAPVSSGQQLSLAPWDLAIIEEAR